MQSSVESETIRKNGRLIRMQYSVPRRPSFRKLRRAAAFLPSAFLPLVLLAPIGCEAGRAESAAAANSDSGNASRDEVRSTGPILLELFTSQGCSSCPPADRLLSELGDGEDVLTLAFHVDYWNRLGWRDPFSDARWSERQQRYAHALPSGVYTPQLVIQGSAHVVGSDRRAVNRALQAERERRKTLNQSEKKDGDPQSDPLQVRARLIDSQAGRAQRALFTVRLAEELRESRNDLRVYAARYAGGRSTDVPRGENRGRTLRNDWIVRELQALPVHGARDENGALTFEFSLSDNAADANGIAVWVQDAESLQVLHVRRAVLE